VKATHAYILCGWNTRSDIPLTSVPTSDNVGERADIVIQIAAGRSPLATNTGRVVFEHSVQRSLIRVEDVADFEINDGRQICVWPAAGVSQKDVEIFLLGPAWATLSHQRGMLPMHASAIATKAGITAVVGHSGVGKSTIAAVMGALGYELVADDIPTVNFNRESVPGAWPYLRRLKLQGGPIAELALTPSEVVGEKLDKQKYFVHPKCVADDKWKRLERVYVLEVDPTVSQVLIDRIAGLDAARALIDQTYHFQFILGTGRYRDHLELCARLVSKVAIYRLRRPPWYGEGKALGTIVRAHLEDTAS